MKQVTIEFSVYSDTSARPIHSCCIAHVILNRKLISKLNWLPFSTQIPRYLKTCSVKMTDFTVYWLFVAKWSFMLLLRSKDITGEYTWNLQTKLNFMLTYQKEARTIIQEEDRNLQLVALIQRKYLRGKGRKTIQMTFRILDFFFLYTAIYFFYFIFWKSKLFPFSQFLAPQGGFQPRNS